MTQHTPGPWLSNEQVTLLNERHGWFQYGDAQSDVSRAFANDAVDMHERMRSAAPDLLVALRDLMSAFETRMADNENVEWHDCWNKAVAAIAKATGQ